MVDIVERLRAAHQDSPQRILGSDIFKVAADELVRLQLVANTYAAELAEQGCKLDQIRQALDRPYKKNERSWDAAHNEDTVTMIWNILGEPK